MSKVSKLTSQSMSVGFTSKTEAVGCAEFAIAGKRTISRDEATRLFADAGDVLEVQFNRMEANMQAMVAAELAVTEHAKRCISSSKDLAAKVGDAMARIDKVVVRDFELKLSQLERFAAAMAMLDELKRNGRIDEIVAAFAHK